MNALSVQTMLRKHSSLIHKDTAKYFFKTDDGCYSAHDKFIGVRMADVRRVAVKHSKIQYHQVQKLLASEIHEYRLCALVILVNKMKKAVKSGDHTEIEHIYNFYLESKVHVNNWDLVDVSAHYIVGQFILLYPARSDVLYELARSENLWDRRIAMVSQWLMIREGHYDHVLPLAKVLLSDKHDLIHKAVGWMLREYWKKQPKAVESFLYDNYTQIPRTSLRNAIEKIEQTRRKKILNGDFSI